MTRVTRPDEKLTYKQYINEKLNPENYPNGNLKMTKSNDDTNTSNQTEKSIDEQKQEKKFLYQFVNHENGQRSEPFVGNWETIKEILDLREEGEAPQDEDFILLVAVLDGAETIIPSTPLITLKTYQQYYNPELQDQQEAS